tara:strand:+ start:28487 stop:29716 length:1230 start_codon:yes stop_codon:yes gene_type:complete
MKIVPIVTAILVSAFLYLLVFERDRLVGFAASNTSTSVPSTAQATELPATADTAIRVVALASDSQEIDSAVLMRGRTQAARQVTVAAETSGTIISEPIRKGANVNAGDLLCRLDPGTRDASLAEAKARLTEAQGRVPEAQAAVAESRARVREAEINVNAARKLSVEGFASETRLVSAEAGSEAATAGVQRAASSVASARAGIEAATAAVAVATREIARLEIRAPFAGLLETDTAELGSLMQPGSSCATIVQLNPMKLIGFTPEADVEKVVIGAAASARLSSGAKVLGRVTFLSRSADESTRTFRVEIEIPNADIAIRDGQTVEINVSAAGRRAHLLPQSALTLDNYGALGIRTIDSDNRAVFMPVTLLRDTAQGVWLADLPASISVIVVGQEFVIDGVQVTPTYREAIQ